MQRSVEIVIAVTGDVVPEVPKERGDFPAIFAQAIDLPEARYRAVDLRSDEPLPEPNSSIDAIIITGSAANVHHREPWMLRAEEWLRQHVASETAILGVCFGHQLLAQALGGEVQTNPKGREMSTVNITCFPQSDTAADPLLGDLQSFRANACHCDTVTALPPEARALACSSGDPHQVIRFGTRCYGVQFHPEFDETIMAGYLQARGEAARNEGLDVAALHSALAPTPDAKNLLRRFVENIAAH